MGEETLFQSRRYRLSLRMRASRYERVRWLGWLLFLGRYYSYGTYHGER